MIHKFLSRSSLALFVAASPLVAQEGSDTFSAASTEGSAVTESSTFVETTTTETSVEPEVPSFFFPGGYGYLPETIAPGTGIYARPPVDFSLTIQTGYNDNIYSSSGKNGAAPKKGSATTQATAGVNLLLNTPRAFLSFGANAGALYYWDKPNSQISPVGTLSSAFAYSITPRVQLNARVNAGYYSQPNLSLPNTPRVNSGDYFNLASLFDLSYRWTPTFTTNTSFGVNTQIFRDSESQDSNYVEWFVGESFRYLFAPRFTGVAEVRFSQINYDGEIRNSKTESVMAGFDWLMTPRLTSTFRGGVSFRQFELSNADDATSPYFESALGYRYGRGSLLQWTTRFGFEEANQPFNRNQTFRTGLSISQILTPRLNGSLGVSYAHETYKGLLTDSRDTQQLISGNARLEFIATRSLTIFGNYNRSQNISDFSNSDYIRNEVSVGATYHF